jgi:hypothetical protein
VDSPCLGYGSLAGCCECGDEPSGSVTTELVNSKLQTRYVAKMAVFWVVVPCLQASLNSW